MHEHDTTFSANYTASCLGVLPSDAVPLVYARDGTRPTGLVPGPALLVCASKAGSRWYAQFQGSAAGYGRHGIYHTPNPEDICVIAQGQAYCGPVSDPLRIETLKACPIVTVCPAVEAGVLVLVSYTDVLVIGAADRWRLRDIASDGIRDVSVSLGCVVGEAWLAAADGWKPFRVDLRTRELHYR